MNQTWENKNTSNFRPDFELLDPNLGQQIFLEGFTCSSRLAFFQAIILWNLKEN